MSSLQRVRAMTVLFVVTIGGHPLWAAAPIKLNGPLVAGGSVSEVRMSPDGSRVVYLADQGVDEVDEIFSVPILGGTPIKLNGPLVAGGDVDNLSNSLQISPDSSRVLYVADQDADEVFEIFSVPITGGTPIKLNGPLVAGGDVDRFADNQFSPISSRVLYLADEDTDAVNELFSVLSTGGGQIKLNGPLVANGDVDRNGLQFSPAGARILYRADQDTDEVHEIYSVTGGGTSLVKLNGALAAGGDVTSFSFRPDGTRVLYLADQTADEVFEIFTVPSFGGTPDKLNGTLVANGDVSEFGPFSPDGSRVLYFADQTVDEVFELYSVPTGGGTPVKLNGPLVAGGDVRSENPDINSHFSPDGSRVLYRADQVTDEVDELFIVPSGGGTPVKLNGPLVAGGDVTGFKFSPDGSRVVYRADQDTDLIDEIYSVPSGGGTPVKLNGPLVPGGDVSGNNFVKFSPDGSRVAYKAEHTALNSNDLFIVPSGGGTAVKVNGPLVASGDVSNYEFSPDGSIIVYHADQEANSVFEVYARIVRLHSVGAGGGWDAGSSWDHGVAPDEVMQVFIDGSANVTATGSATPRPANALQVGNGSGNAKLTLASNAVITAVNGVSIDNGGEVRGDGQIVGDVAIGPLGVLRASSNEQLRISGNVLSEGSIVASGLPGAPAEIEFDGNTENFNSIAARFAILRFTGGLYNETDLSFVSGSSDVFGDVNNQGTIDISSSAVVTFHDDVQQDATLHVEQTGANSGVAVFLGAFTGSGGSTGGGNIFFHGDVRPGDSPAIVDFDKNVTFGAGATLEIEIGGTLPGLQYDQVQVAGNLSLDGTLAVSLINDFSPALGNSFDILDWTSLSGKFDTLQLPALGADLMWNSSLLYTAGILRVALAGDFNIDGTVDAADYVVWRKTDGTPAGYNAWRTHFGQTAGSGSGASGSASVPEPATIVMLIVTAAGVSTRRRWRT